MATKAHHRSDLFVAVPENNFIVEDDSPSCFGVWCLRKGGEQRFLQSKKEVVKENKGKENPEEAHPVKRILLTKDTAARQSLLTLTAARES